MPARAQTIRAAMIEASRRQSIAASPAERYHWIGVWWLLHARESAFPAQGLAFAHNQFALAADIERRPRHYADKPHGVTDWQHSGLGEAESKDDRQ